jgi:hypothetical protein
MTIWILAFLLLAAGAAMGHKQGAIRVVISFVGIIISALLAWPLSGIIRAILPHIGVHHPLTIWLLPPLIVFVIVLAAFKSLALWAHHKTDVYYRYHTDDIQHLLWERLNKRVGLAFGLLNGLVYFIIVCCIIFDASYWTTQMAPTDGERLGVRLLNRMGWDLQGTGVIHAVRARNQLPEIFFQAADLAGTLYQNPQLADRLSAYPAFLSLSERDDFKQLGQDTEFQTAWKEHAAFNQLWNNPRVEGMRHDLGTVRLIGNLVLTNLDDLQKYLQTGHSTKFSSEPIVGRWNFNVMASLTALVQALPSVTTGDMMNLRNQWTPAYAKTMFVAGADGQAFLKDLPHFVIQPNQPTTVETATWQGQWKNSGDKYDLTLGSSGGTKTGTGTIDGTRLTLKLGTDTFVFDQQE